MKIRLRKPSLPSPSLVVSVIALFVALGGTAGAAVLITSKDIKDGTIQNADVAKKAIDHTKLVEGTDSGLNADKLDNLSSEQIAAMPGPASSAIGLLTTRTANYSIGADQGGDFEVKCATGEKVTGGGSSSFGSVVTFDSRPNTESSWAVYVVNFGSEPVALTAWAICVR